MKKTVTAYTVVYLNDNNTFGLSSTLLHDEVEAKRSINMFEGRPIVAIVPVTFEYDKESLKDGLEYRADEKLAGRIPCRITDENGVYRNMTEEELNELRREHNV